MNAWLLGWGIKKINQFKDTRTCSGELYTFPVLKSVIRICSSYQVFEAGLYVQKKETLNKMFTLQLQAFEISDKGTKITGGKITSILLKTVFIPFCLIAFFT